MKFNNIAKLDSIENSFFKIVNYHPINLHKKVILNSILLKKDDFIKKVLPSKTYRSLISLVFLNMLILVSTLLDNNQLKPISR